MLFLTSVPFSSQRASIKALLFRYVQDTITSTNSVTVTWFMSPFFLTWTAVIASPLLPASALAPFRMVHRAKRVILLKSQIMSVLCLQPSSVTFYLTQSEKQITMIPSGPSSQNSSILLPFAHSTFFLLASYTLSTQRHCIFSLCLEVSLLRCHMVCYFSSFMAAFKFIISLRYFVSSLQESAISKTVSIPFSAFIFLHSLFSTV